MKKYERLIEILRTSKGLVCPEMAAIRLGISVDYARQLYRKYTDRENRDGIKLYYLKEEFESWVM